MRRTAIAIAGLGLTTMAGLGLTAALLVPAAARTAGPPVPSGPYAAAATSPDEAESPGTPATLLANVAPATVPGISELASPKPSVLPYSASPGGPIVGQLPARRWGAPVVRPVVQHLQAGWVELRLDTRPNGSTGWVRQKDVTITTTPSRIVISISQRRLTFYQAGVPVYSAPVGVGKSQTATPIGPSFVNAVVAVPQREQYIYGPVVLLTASHSNVFTEFDGGDGTVGIHGYPSNPASTMGVASSHGCVRASPQTMATIAHVSVGTPVDIVA